MPLTRLALKNTLKSRRGLTRDREDGLLPDALFHEAINESIIAVGIDCGILPARFTFSLEAGEWKYPIPEDMFELRSLWYIESNGNHNPIDIVTEEQFQHGRNPETDTSTEPYFAAYPIYENQVIHTYGLFRPQTDFVETSRITSGHIRTVEDTGINLGRTREGIRISPGDMIKNLSRDSYGYVDFLDTITEKASAVTLAAGTTSSIAKHPTTWPTTIKEDDIICTPATGNVTSYAFVVSISGADLTYEAIRGSATAFSSGDVVKVGVAQKIRLSIAAPHRGLREGSLNEFYKGSTTATMTGTTFTDTKCTGSSPSGAAIGEVGIASGGSHGVITAVGSDYIDVSGWVGGSPAAGETVTIQTCDEYQVLTRPQIEPIMFIGPTPSSSDAAGTRSMVASYIKRPFLPEADYQYIDIPDKYRKALYKCGDWQLHELAGNKTPRQLSEYEQLYKMEATVMSGDIDRPPKGQVMTVTGNRTGPMNRYGSRYTTRSGVTYDISNL